MCRESIKTENISLLNALWFNTLVMFLHTVYVLILGSVPTTIFCDPQVIESTLDSVLIESIKTSPMCLKIP